MTNFIMDVKTVILNVRGVKYQVMLDSLNKHCNTRLERLRNEIINENRDEIAKLCDGYSKDLNEFYFDRDPYVLNMILNYNLSNKLHINHKECVYFVRDELEYWQIDEYALEDCCKIIYFEKLSELQELIDSEESLRRKLHHKEDFGTRFYPELRERLWNLFDNPRSSIYAKLLFCFSIFVICLSVAVIIIQTIPEIQHDYKLKFVERTSINKGLSIIQLLCFIWFVIELLVRFICCPHKCKFLQKPLNIIDGIIVCTIFVWLVASSYNLPRIFKKIINILRIVLLLKISRHSAGLKQLGETLKKSSKELGILLVYLTFGVLFFSSVVYYCEKEQEQFSSIPATFWWGIATMTTVGYGDMVPKSPLGKAFGSVCAICGVLIVSLPIGIISANFSKILDKRHKESKIMKIRRKLIKFDSKFYCEILPRSCRREYSRV